MKIVYPVFFPNQPLTLKSSTTLTSFKKKTIETKQDQMRLWHKLQFLSSVNCLWLNGLYINSILVWAGEAPGPHST